MTDRPGIDWRKEAIVFAATVIVALVLVPPVVAALAYQSGQAMFWPALQSLYTYFFKYTLLAAIGVAVLVEITRLAIKRLRGPSASR